MNKHGLTIAIIAQQFLFSDYYHVCKDIERYALAKYNPENAGEIKDKLQDILEALYQKFFALHNACYAKHPNNDILQEIVLMKLLSEDVPGLKESFGFQDNALHARYGNNAYDISEFITNNLETIEMSVEIENKGIQINEPLDMTPDLTLKAANANVVQGTFSIESEILLETGTIANKLLLYKKAIHDLTQAIKLDPNNREAYLERAFAYFETNQIKLALSDYKKIEEITIPPLNLRFAFYREEGFFQNIKPILQKD